MIITRTPFRISFAGGGTDLREFYSQEPGRVISTSIDKYIYVVIKRQLGIVERKYRINWSQVEFKDKIEDIEHPIVKEALKFFKVDFPIRFVCLLNSSSSKTYLSIFFDCIAVRENLFITSFFSTLGCFLIVCFFNIAHYSNYGCWCYS